jgi:hypothetical protein
MAGILTPWALGQGGWDFARITARSQIHCFFTVKVQNSELNSEKNSDFFSESQTRMGTGENEWDQGNNSGLTVNFIRREFLDLLVLHLPAIEHAST